MEGETTVSPSISCLYLATPIVERYTQNPYFLRREAPQKIGVLGFKLHLA